jgi:hypothetical protein
MGFKAITNLLSVDHYYGLNEYGDNSDSDGFWGVHDEPYLLYYAEPLVNYKSPFLLQFLAFHRITLILYPNRIARNI